MGEQTACFYRLSLGSWKPEQATEVVLETGEISRHGLDWIEGIEGAYHDDGRKNPARCGVSVT